MAEVRDAERRRSRSRKPFRAAAAVPALRSCSRNRCSTTRREGALFAAEAGRCLIADDMGLGKTIQALAAAEIMARLFSVQRVLIVCPTSLKHQWQREIERFTRPIGEVVGGLRGSRQAQFADRRRSSRSSITTRSTPIST